MKLLTDISIVIFLIGVLFIIGSVFYSNILCVIIGSGLVIVAMNLFLKAQSKPFDLEMRKKN